MIWMRNIWQWFPTCTAVRPAPRVGSLTLVYDCAPGPCRSLFGVARGGLTSQGSFLGRYAFYASRYRHGSALVNSTPMNRSWRYRQRKPYRPRTRAHPIGRLGRRCRC